MESLPGARPAHKAKKTIVAEERVSATFKIPVPTYRRLKQIAADQGTNVQELLTEALDAWLAKRSEAPFDPDGGPI